MAKILKEYLFSLAAAAVLAGCATLKPVSDSYAELTLPGQAEAEAVAASVASASGAVIPVNTAAGPRIFSFIPAESAEEVTVVSIGPEKGEWTMLNKVIYPCFHESGLEFRRFTEDAEIRDINGTSFVKLGTLRDNGTLAERTYIVFDPEKEELEYVSFSGKYLADGRIEGNSNIEFLARKSAATIWADSLFAEDTSLVELSEADILTDQAISWWLENNPAANTSATKVSYGTIPAESSLVSGFKSAGKQSSSGFNAALLNIRGYTVIVAQRKSNGNFLLLWAEPECRNKNTDRLLNNIYFRGDNTLVLFYYQGKKTFNYQINLANARLMR